MKIKLLKIFLAPALLLAGLASAANTNIPWVLVGNASASVQGRVALTKNVAAQAGGMWNPCPINLGSDFDLIFNVNFGSDCFGADGLAFVLQGGGTGVLGSDSGEHGYANGSIGQSLAIAFDTMSNTGAPYSDPSYDNIEVQTGGNDSYAGPAICGGTGQISGTCTRPPISSTENNVKDGQDHVVEIQWTASTFTFNVTVDGSLRSSWTVASDYATSIFGTSSVYYGFTASTGGATNYQQVAQINANPGAGVCANTPVPTTSYTPIPLTPASCISSPTPTKSATPAAIQITKSMNPANANSGDLITFSLKWAYNGAAAADSMSIGDVLDNSLPFGKATYVSYNVVSGISPTSSTTGSSLSWTWTGSGIVLAGSTGQIDLVVQATGGLYVGNTATINSSNGSGTLSGTSNFVQMFFFTATPSQSPTSVGTMTPTPTASPSAATTATVSRTISATLSPTTSATPTATPTQTLFAAAMLSQTKTPSPVPVPTLCGPAPVFVKSGVLNSSGCAGAGNPTSWSYTVPSGSNQILIVQVEANGFTISGGVTFNGAALSPFPSFSTAAITGGGNIYSYYMSQPPTGSFTLAVPGAVGCNWNVVATLYANVDPLSPFGAISSNGGNNATFTDSINTNSPYSMVHDFFAYPSGPVAFSGSYGTQLFNANTSNCCDDVYGSYLATTGAGTFVNSYGDPGGATNWTGIVAELKAVSCSGSPTATPVPPTPGTGGPDPGQRNSYCYPDPIRRGPGHFVFWMCGPGHSHIRIYQATGNQVGGYSQEQAGGGVKEVTLSLDGYAPGVYFYVVDRHCGSGITDTTSLQKFIITR